MTHDGPPQEFVCFDQKAFGKCNEPYMLNTISELPEGYCQITCGRCDCCSTFTELAEANGLTEFVLAMEAAGLGDLLGNPGWMATLLIPTNQVLQDWRDSRGVAWDELVLNKRLRAELMETMKMHVIVPLASINALWTRPFFLDGVQLQSMSERHPDIIVESQNGTVSFKGPLNRIRILNTEWEACKGFIYTVDGLFRAGYQLHDDSQTVSVQG
eukprot:g5771.t1